ncbi:hypothetical protein J4G46_01625 [Acinetobacter towneri]|uniref:hypothetical protein n=1 Tax=Acinetobacter towneri TaxID=202956 RepID=UPI001AA09209|nr:hypothetical protein [Acinetobacter towneri]QTD64564.1 hypothetical protein J4G46_01625 [Acinetobacter towneri]
MAETHVISGLIRKRAELLGQIEVHQKEIQRIAEILQHVDHTIKLFSPEFDLRSVKSKRKNQRNPYFGRGELQSLVLACLRDAIEPINYKQIATYTLATKGIDTALEVSIESNIRVVLKRLQTKGIVSSIGNERPCLWKLAN